jgi:predicted RNA polymerase sigma factor
VLAELLPAEAEVHGLVALMELQASRARARIGTGGAPILLLDQDRSRWDWVLVERGLAALERAYRTGAAPGPYTLQAAIAACHARARAAEDTDWERIVALYDGLAQLMPSPVVELNRAWRSAWRAARRRRLSSLRPSARSRRYASTTSCRPFAATCSSGWAARHKPAASSSAPQR